MKKPALPFKTDRIPGSRITWLIALAVLLQLFLFSPGHSQTDLVDPGFENTDKSRRHLFLITKRRLVLQRQMDELLKKPASEKVAERAEKLQAQIDKLDLDFESMATQLSLDDPSLKKKKKLDWIEEVQELTKPLLNAVKDLTEKPRMIEEYKSRIEELEAQLELHQEATKSLKVLLEDIREEPPPDTPEGNRLESRLNILRDKYDPELVKLNLHKARFNLQKLLSTDESVVESATKTIENFFKTRGRNLLVTIAIFAGLWWVLSRLRRWILSRKFLSKKKSSIGKLFSAAYNFVVLLFCLMVGLASLYFFNDWLLITLIIMGLVLMVWTSRQWIPKFLQEIKLIVDLGTVRENQRLMWQGVPWRVEEIRLQALLVNDRLEEGEIYLPLHELVGKHSRPVVDNEPWFPTKPKDWVLLADGSYGQVEHQTMEQVVLRLKGGALKYFATGDFLAQNPVNISDGFRYNLQFGLDYGIQSRICDEIPKLFEDAIKNHLKHHFEGGSPDFNHLEVSFDSAGASSLNLRVIVHVDGRCAEFYEEYQRELQTTLVRICNENDLVIPFNQLTVSLADDHIAVKTLAAKRPNNSEEGRV